MGMLVMSYILSTVILVITLAQSHGETSGLTLLTNGTNVQVTGSLLTFCGSPVLYSPAIPPIPLNVAIGDHGLRFPKWKTDWSTECLKSRAEMVDYCRRVFANTNERITDVMLATIFVPLHLPTHDLLPNSGKILPKAKVLQLKPYWCLVGEQPLGIHAQPSHHPLPPSTHDLPTILDIHRAFFLRRYNKLNNRTEETTSRLVNHVIHAVEQLVSLPAVNHQQVLLLTSNLLQSAHEQLQSVWTSNEIEWSQLESQRHAKVIAERASEDLAGEHEFAYVLQEPGASIDRLQTALSRLLGSLADSVQEEVYDLSAVLKHQPARLQLTAPVDQADDQQQKRLLPRYAISLAKVHGALLRLVQQATVAINILRERMRSDVGGGVANITHASAPAPHQQPHYQPELVANYQRLQTQLTEARRVLSLAKQRVLSDLTVDSRSLVASLKGAMTAGEANTSGVNASAAATADPWGVLVKHREELAYLDFMVGHVLTSFPGQRLQQATRPLGISDSQLLTWSRIWRPESGDLAAAARPNRLTDCRKPFSASFIFGFLLAFKGIALVLCISLSLLLVGAMVYLARQHCCGRCRAGGRVRRRQQLLVDSLQQATKRWLAGTFLGPSVKRKRATRRPPREGDQLAAEAGPVPVESASNGGSRPPGNVHGYANPFCDIPKTLVVGHR